MTDAADKLTVVLRADGRWWFASCTELQVGGMGETKDDAEEALIRSMKSVLNAQVYFLNKGREGLEIIANIKEAV